MEDNAGQYEARAPHPVPFPVGREREIKPERLSIDHHFESHRRVTSRLDTIAAFRHPQRVIKRGTVSVIQFAGGCPFL